MCQFSVESTFESGGEGVSSDGRQKVISLSGPGANVTDFGISSMSSNPAADYPD